MPKKTKAQWLIEASKKTGIDECLIWPFAQNKGGYGNVFFEGKYQNAHRVMCRLTNGDPPQGQMHAAHACGKRNCVNPDHIFWATPSENNMHKFDHGTHRRGDRCNLASLTLDEVLAVRRLKKESPDLTLDQIEEKTGVKRGNAWLVITGKTWDVPEAQVSNA